MRNKKRINKKQEPLPKNVKIVIEDGIYKLYKIWQGNKVGSDPYFITEDIEEAINKYIDCGQDWGFKPNRKYIKSFIN